MDKGGEPLCTTVKSWTRPAGGPLKNHKEFRGKWVARLCTTLYDPVDCSLPAPSPHGILQIRLLEWVAVPFFRASSQPRDRTHVSLIAGRFFTIWATREAQIFHHGGWGRLGHLALDPRLPLVEGCSSEALGPPCLWTVSACARMAFQGTPDVRPCHSVLGPTPASPETGDVACAA